MFRIVALMVLTAAALVGQAQVKVNFTTGLNVSNITGDYISEYGFDLTREEYIAAGGSATSEVKNSVRVGFYLAALADITLNESLFLRSGLKFMNTGDSYFFKTNDVVFVSQNGLGGEEDARYVFRQRLGYLAIPVNVGSALGEKITVYGGLTPAINVSNVVRANYFEPKGDDIKEKWDKEDNPVDPKSVVLFVNAGMNYLIPSAKYDWFLDLAFNHSITGVYDANNTAPATFNDANAWNVDFGFGIKF